MPPPPCAYLGLEALRRSRSRVVLERLTHRRAPVQPRPVRHVRHRPLAGRGRAGGPAGEGGARGGDAVEGEPGGAGDVLGPERLRRCAAPPLVLARGRTTHERSRLDPFPLRSGGGEPRSRSGYHAAQQARVRQTGMASAVSHPSACIRDDSRFPSQDRNAASRASRCARGRLGSGAARNAHSRPGARAACTYPTFESHAAVSGCSHSISSSRGPASRSAAACESMTIRFPNRVMDQSPPRVPETMLQCPTDGRRTGPRCSAASPPRGQAAPGLGDTQLCPRAGVPRRTMLSAPLRSMSRLANCRRHSSRAASQGSRKEGRLSTRQNTLCREQQRRC